MELIRIRSMIVSSFLLVSCVYFFYLSFYSLLAIVHAEFFFSFFTFKIFDIRLLCCSCAHLTALRRDSIGKESLTSSLNEILLFVFRKILVNDWCTSIVLCWSSKLQFVQEVYSYNLMQIILKSQSFSFSALSCFRGLHCWWCLWISRTRGANYKNVLVASCT